MTRANEMETAIGSIPDDWRRAIGPASSHERLAPIVEYVAMRRRETPGVLPDSDRVFAALHATPFESVRAVILGQDPYPTRAHAMGLAFSVPHDLPLPLPRSLLNIRAELHADGGWAVPDHGSLEPGAHRSWSGIDRLVLAVTLRSEPRHVIGIDGFARGWVAVELHDGMFASASAAATLVDLVGAFSGATVYGLDMPIGFAPGGGRAADDEARRLLGGRSSSVFPTPPREALEAANFEEANAVARRLTGKGLSQQSWALRSRVFEANDIAVADERVIEVHPELSFRAMRGEPLQWSKLSWNGEAERRALLAAQGIHLPEDLGKVGGAVPSADLLDAAAAAWSADRVATGLARHVPDALPQTAGRPVAIWY